MLTNLNEILNVGDRFECSRQKIGALSKQNRSKIKIKGVIVAKTNNLFVIERMKFGKKLFKESFRYIDLDTKEIGGVKINGQVLTRIKRKRPKSYYKFSITR